MKSTSSSPGVVAVLREPVFSPGMVDHDAAILRASAAELTGRHGVACPVLTARELATLDHAPRLVLSMAEGEEALDALGALERRGTIVVNSTAAVRRTRRAELLAFSRPAGPLVEGALVATNDGAGVPASILEAGSAWVKRADYHSLGAGDVVRVETIDLIRALRTLHARGIPQAVVQPHVPGSITKFYGVLKEDTPFFRSFPTQGTADTVGLDRLRTLALEVARRAGIDVFGGDAVLSPDREPVIVDLNAWPSFWRCLADAAPAIAAHAASVLERTPAPSTVACRRS
jgi:hypothetical protein